MKQSHPRATRPSYVLTVLTIACLFLLATQGAAAAQPAQEAQEAQEANAPASAASSKQDDDAPASAASSKQDDDAPASAASSEHNDDAPASAASSKATAHDQAWLLEQRLERIGERLVPWTGSWITASLFLGITWLKLLASLLIVLLVALLDWLLRQLIHRKIREDEAADTAEEPERARTHWLARSLRAAIPPLATLIWIYGLYLALYILLAHLRAEPYPYLLITALDVISRASAFVIFFWFLFRLVHVVEAEIMAWAEQTEAAWDDILAPLVGKALRLLVPLVAFHIALPALPLSPAAARIAQNLASILLIGAIAFMAVQLVRSAAEAILSQYRVDVDDNLEARKIHTQVRMLKKVALVVIAIFGLASILMVFDSVRQLGASLLASAGIAGIIVGFAAQRSIATLVAGFQIAITQPIRLDDVVIVENEWGRIEEITLTYVVVRIWDLRRLVLPITYFIEKPFQNWTRTSADILGTVFLYMDYGVPLPALREELTRVLHASPHWDRKVNVLQVTDFKPHMVEVRALASAADAGKAWDLRCELREKLLEFIRRAYPESLPRFRAELTPAPHGAAPGQPGSAPDRPAPAH